MIVSTLFEKKLPEIKADETKPTFWQLVFSQSKANGAFYDGDDLPGYKWEWPKDTYLQRRLSKRNHGLN